MTKGQDIVARLIKQIGKEQHHLVALLIGLQDELGYLPAEVLQELADKTGISARLVTACATFYDHFRLKEVGRHIISVCIGTACHVKGAERVYDSFRDHLNIQGDDDTDKDKVFTVEKVACLGCCMMAPAVKIDEVIYGWVEPARVGEVIDDFLASAASTTALPQEEEEDRSVAEVKLCTCSSCRAAGAQDVFIELRRLARDYELPVHMLDVGCTGMSFQAPLMQVTDHNGTVFHYGKVEVDSVSSILLHHFASGSLGHILDRLLQGGQAPIFRHRIDHSNEDTQKWLHSKKRIVTAGCGTLAPLDLPAYRQSGGFYALKKAVDMDPSEIISELSLSNLRGRGGGGFKTATKWQMVADSKEKEKYVVCNADEGDPGAFMDRMLLESFPYRVIEGMLIAACTISAKKAFVYVRSEYPLAISRLRKALKRCADESVFASTPLDTIEVMVGAGAFVCGEETALLASIEGRRPTPSLRPPYPSESGLWGKPTLVNNVETFATIPWIIKEGGQSFVDLGAADSTGTKTFALAGKIERGGLIEVPMGLTIDEIIDDFGGGVANGRKVKAVQIGGPSGGCVPASSFDLPVDYDKLQEAGAIMGSGGLVVLDEYDCMVDIARYFLLFTAHESCGICTCCRVASVRMLDILENLCQGRGQKRDLEKLEELGEMMKKGSRCGLGKTGPNPVLTTLQFFQDEYEEHLSGFCRAGVCQNLTTFTTNSKCNGCMLCSRSCPVAAIPYAPWQKMEIEQDKCIRCGACRQTCPEMAIDAVRGDNND